MLHLSVCACTLCRLSTLKGRRKEPSRTPQMQQSQKSLPEPVKGSSMSCKDQSDLSRSPLPQWAQNFHLLPWLSFLQTHCISGKSHWPQSNEIFAFHCWDLLGRIKMTALSRSIDSYNYFELSRIALQIHPGWSLLLSGWQSMFVENGTFALEN